MVLGGRMAWQTGELKLAIERSRYRTDIVLPGFISEEELPIWMGAARAFVYPSLFEGFGLPVLESMYAEVPVLTSKVSSLPEVAGEAALLVDPESIPSIADGLSQLDADSQLRQLLVEKGKRQREKFSWARAAEIVYQKLENPTGTNSNGVS